MAVHRWRSEYLLCRYKWYQLLRGNSLQRCPDGWLPMLWAVYAQCSNHSMPSSWRPHVQGPQLNGGPNRRIGSGNVVPFAGSTAPAAPAGSAGGAVVRCDWRDRGGRVPRGRRRLRRCCRVPRRSRGCISAGGAGGAGGCAHYKAACAVGVR